MEAKIFHLPLTWSAQRFRNYFDCQLKQEKQSWKKKNSDASMSAVERVP